ncbi:MAG TPA: TolC family protein [Limnobacter sp.]|uniref:TolC family protein n=1 Tax=Limnobacter sp. TaxID=2003368 RepID=UPI002ED78E1B
MSLLTQTSLATAQTAQPNAIDPTLQRYVSEALLNNPGLVSANLDVEAERQRLENLRARYYPSLSLQARASVSEGGRTIDFPAGDLLNPVYQALNAQLVMNGQPPRFPTVQNQSIPLLRPTEQDTRLQLRGPIYEPVLNGQVKAQTEVLNAQQAAQLQVKEELVRDLQVSYWQLAQAHARIEVLRKSLATLEENRRVNQQLYKAGETTLDAPRRAEAEVLDVQVQLKDAEKQARLAREYFNLLRFAPAASAVDMAPQEDNDAAIEQLTEVLQPREAGNAAAPALTRLERSLAAQQAAMEAARATYKPTLGYQIEGGYQGRDYQTGPNTGFATASVVLSWTLADGGVRSSEVARAKAQADALQVRAAQVSRQLQLAKTQATENLLVSLDSIAARMAQRKAADESLRIVSKKRDAGEATQIEFLSSEQAATRARLGLIAAVHQARIDHAIWQYNNRDIPDYALPQGVQP